MFEYYFHRRHIRRRLESGPLAGIIHEYVRHLHERGHSDNSVRAYVQATEHFGQWLKRFGHVIDRVDSEIIDRFLARHLPHCRCFRLRSRCVHVVRAALRQLLVVVHQYRRASPPQAAPGTIDGALEDFDAYLTTTCGTSPATRRYYLREARGLLASRFALDCMDLGALAADDVRGFIRKRAQSLRPSSVNVVGTAVRAFLRFLRLRGVGGAAWSNAVPRAAHWGKSQLPRVLTELEHAAFLAAFDRTTALGRRDYAIATCLSDLGLRAGEVARLTLDDIDWRAGILAIAPGKCRRGDRLPLPTSVACALVDYLRFGRPSTSEREVFVYHRAPRGKGVGPSLVRCAVRRAYARAGLDPRLTGTHVLRHTTATRLLRSGACMKEVADLLRHRSLDTSAIYAKVDESSLVEVAQRWPEVQP